MTDFELQIDACHLFLFQLDFIHKIRIVGRISVQTRKLGFPHVQIVNVSWHRSLFSRNVGSSLNGWVCVSIQSASTSDAFDLS